ncbi:MULTISPECIES: hypothetical protein [Oleiagrimonas]|uniref:hypothetical protein n=1 Tax=Oleiagrimonas TaxID=1649642 RepID=UPI000DC5DF59|nr:MULTISPECIES: hypothetical protein [Oleiagrimonas]RAP58367.1 hypothetical protein BTJ49_05305 [Oleiagrimonas sp. MCCC 1A03011]
MRPTQALLVLLFSGAFLAAPGAYAKNDGLLGHGTTHGSAHSSRNATHDDSANGATGDLSVPSGSTSASSHASSDSGIGCEDSSSATASSSIGRCGSSRNGGSDSSGDAHPSLGWQSLLPGSIQ